MKEITRVFKKLNPRKFFSAIGRGLFWIWAKISIVVKAVIAVCDRFRQSVAYPITIKIIIVLIIIAGIIQFLFGAMLYGFRDKTYNPESKFSFIYRAADSKVVDTVANIIPYPVAVVNYGFITYRDFSSEKTYIHHFYSSTKQEGIDYKQIDRQVVDQLIENKIVMQKSLRHQVKVDKKELDDTMNLLSDQNGGRDKVEKILNDLYGLTYNQFRNLVKIQLLRDKLDNKVIARVSVNHILIRLDATATADQATAAKAKVDSVLAEIKGGLDFAEAAKKYSEDVGSADQGGKLDPFAKGEMVDPFSDIAFSTSAGQISDPFQTEFGWHILKVEGKTGTIDKKFSDWMAEIKKNSLVLKFFEK